MNWKSYVFPQVLYSSSSVHSKEIRVIDYWGTRRLVVDNIQQTGPQISTLWTTLFRTRSLPVLQEDSRVLMLGVAGGGVMKLLFKMCQKIHIDAVDIDQEIINVTKTYFGFKHNTHVSFLCQDAKDYVKTAKKTYDVIVSDTFIARCPAEFLRTQTFHTHVKRHLKKGGVYIVNYLGELEQENPQLERVLSAVFRVVEIYDISYNRFFVCYD